MLVLTNLRAVRLAAGITPAVMHTVLASGAGFNHLNARQRAERYRRIEIRAAEPWFDEARTISAVLQTPILKLVSASDDLTLSGVELDRTVLSAHDHAAWGSGARIPLSLAVRLARTFGLHDMCDLVVSAMTQQIWDIMEANERNAEARGWCPWCQVDRIGGEPHLPTCLPQFLWGEKTRGFDGMVVPRPEAVRSRGKAIAAYGLRVVREARGRTQAEIAAAIGVTANHYAQMERQRHPLTPENAEALAHLYGIEKERLYAAPEDEA